MIYSSRGLLRQRFVSLARAKRTRLGRKVGTRRPQPPLKFTQGPSGSALLKALRLLTALVYYWETSVDGTSFMSAAIAGAEPAFAVS